MHAEGLIPVRPAERRAVAAGFAVLFFLLSSHALVETARDALFLQSLPVERLPWVYLLVALLGALVGAVPVEAGGRRGLLAWLWASALVLCGLWLWAGQGGIAGPVALYAWSGLAVSISLVQVWHLVSQRFSVDAAKRVFGVVGAGGLLGAIAGSVVGAGLASWLPVRHLLLAAALLQGVSAFAVLGLGSGRRTRLRLRSLGLVRDLRVVLGHAYAARLAALALLATTAFTLVDYLFKAQVSATVPAADLGPWFASFYALTNAMALAVQLLATGLALRWLGVRRAVAVLPMLLLGGAVGLAAGAGLGAALLLKGAEGSLKHSLHRTALEVLYVPVPEHLRARLRRVADLLLLRVAQGLGSALILIALAAGGGARTVAALAAVLALGWIGLSMRLRGHYLDLFRGILRRGGAAGEVDGGQTLDLAALEAMLEALNSDDDDEVLASLDLLDRVGRTHLVPSLILFHPSSRVVVGALDRFARAGRVDHLVKAQRLAVSPDPEVRAAVVRAQPDHSYAVRAMQDPAPIVRCTALATLCSEGGHQARVAEPQLRQIAREGSAEERVALCRALGQQAHGPLQISVLAELARARSARERAAAAACIATRPQLGHAPAAIGLLGTREARADARRALVAVGAPVLPLLEDALADTILAEGVRIHLPMVIAELASPEAATLLARSLVGAGSGVLRYRLLRALNRLHGLAPDLPLPTAPLLAAVRDTVLSLYWMLDWSILLAEGARAQPKRRTPGHELLSTLLDDKQANARERLFRLLDLMHEGEDFEDLWRGVLSSDPRRRGSSLELLEHALPRDLRGAVVGLFDQSRAELLRLDRLAPGGAFYKPAPDDYDAMLSAMLTAGSESVQAIAAWHAGELGRVELLPALRTLSQSGVSAEVVAHAIEALERSPGGRP